MSVSKFYQIELTRLKNESEKISFFTKHPPTIGSYREKLLRDYLALFTPKNLKIESGFVFDFENAEKDQLFKDQTRQVDCLVFDDSNGELQKQLSIEHLNQLPEYICVLDKVLIYFSRVLLFEDEANGLDSSQTQMTVIESVEENIAFPLQFFTNAYKIHIEYSLLMKSPHKGGLFTAGLGIIKTWGHHFDLCSE
jgi:hypothetical protein